MSLTLEIERAKAQGAEELAGFTGAVRSLDLSTLEKGDVFTLPETYEVYREKIGDNHAEFIFVETQSGEVKKLYPSMFTKSRSLVNEDGSIISVNGRAQRMSSSGSACDEFRKHATVQDAMNALATKTIEVSDVKTGRVLRFGSSQPTNTQFLVLNLVDNKAN